MRHDPELRVRQVRLALIAVLLVFLAACGDSPSAESPLIDVQASRSASEPDDRTPPSESASDEEPDGSDEVIESGDDEAPTMPTPPNSESDDSTGESEPVLEEPAEVGVPDDVEDEPVSEFDEITSELITFVEENRGHRFVERPRIVPLDDVSFVRAFAELVAEDAERYRSDYENFTDIYRAMGVIERSQTLEEIWTSFGDAGALGFYDGESGDVILRGDEVNALTRTTLVHELTHALDDQVHGLDRPEYDDRDDEISWTFSALKEGSARVIENRYRDTMTQAERDEEVTLRLNLPRSVSLSSFTNSFLDLQFGRYTFGETFVDSLWAQGQDAVDAAFADPPTTSEQVIDPTRYSEPADAALEPPVSGAATFEAGLWGQAGWAAVFADVLGDGEAQAAAEGWGGDWFVAWRQGGQTCVRLHLAADSARDLDEFADALELWVSEGDRDVFYPTAELIRVTSCG